jgi:hypothetical protein
MRVFAIFLGPPAVKYPKQLKVPVTVYTTQNYWGAGLLPTFYFLEKATFRKPDLFPSSGDGGSQV